MSAQLPPGVPPELNRRILLIGGAGLVGRHIAPVLPKVDLTVTYHRSPTPGGTPLDITDGRAVNELIETRKPDVIILAAADPFVERCEREPEATRAVNVVAARTVSNVAKRIGAKLVVFSSEYVFDGRRGPYAEDATLSPLNEYGRQKAELERIVAGLPRHLICRTSGVFGWEPARKNFVCQVVDRLRAGREFVVPSDQVITPTYAPDLGMALRDLIARGLGGTINLVGPDVVLRPDFARRVCDAFGLDPSLIIARPTRDLGLVAARPHSAGLTDDLLRRSIGRGLGQLRVALEDMRATEASAMQPTA